MLLKRYLTNDILELCLLNYELIYQYKIYNCNEKKFFISITLC